MKAKDTDRKIHHYLATFLYLFESVQLLERLHLNTVTNWLHVILLHSGRREVDVGRPFLYLKSLTVNCFFFFYIYTKCQNPAILYTEYS